MKIHFAFPQKNMNYIGLLLPKYMKRKFVNMKSDTAQFGPNTRKLSQIEKVAFVSYLPRYYHFQLF